MWTRLFFQTFDAVRCLRATVLLIINHLCYTDLLACGCEHLPVSRLRHYMRLKCIRAPSARFANDYWSDKIIQFLSEISDTMWVSMRSTIRIKWAYFSHFLNFKNLLEDTGGEYRWTSVYKFFVTAILKSLALLLSHWDWFCSYLLQF